MYNIDDFDMKILTLLQANGRLTNQELSELVGLSASQCSRRRIRPAPACGSARTSRSRSRHWSKGYE